MSVISTKMPRNISSAGRENFAQTLRSGSLFIFPKIEARKAEERGLSTALANYFAERALMQQRDLNELFRVGRRYLSIGVPVLVLCLIGSQLARTRLGTGPLGSAIAESLVLLGWVANWKPIETFLYDWWPLKRRRDLYRRLALAVVEIRGVKNRLRYLTAENDSRTRGRLEPKWIGLGHPFQFRDVQRLDRRCPIDPNVFVELARQDRLKVVAGEFTLWPVDDADRAFEKGLHEFLVNFVRRSRF